jgi:hypothetical protein
VPGLSIADVWLSQYITYSDSVTMDDLTEAFERARLESFPNQKFACITHSTGGPLAREWAARYTNSSELMTHLVMLAPPNHGSALAQLGKGRISRLASWFEQQEPGAQILNWLELGSRESWRLNLDGLDRSSAGFEFTLAGGAIDAKFYDHLNSYTGEKSSDGVVRTAAANLNYSYVELAQSGGGLVVKNKKRSSPNAFGVVPAVSHSGASMGIVSSPVTAEWVKKCLAVGNDSDYQHVSDELQQLTSQATQAGSMIVVRVTDAIGRPVNDYDLYLTGGPAYSPDALPKGFFIDRQRNQVTPNVLTYYLDHAAFEQSKELGLKIVARPDSGPVSFAPAEFRTDEATVASILRPHETVMLNLRLERTLSPALFLVRRAA